MWILSTKTATRALLYIIPLFGDPREQEVSPFHFIDKETRATEESNFPKDEGKSQTQQQKKGSRLSGRKYL